jgi:quinol monooxygenase YgiN
MIILAGTIRIGAGKREAALAPMREMVAATSAEPGCVHYSFAFDLQDDHVVHIFEVFTDAGALAQHRSSPHMATWRARGAELGLRDRDMAEYQVSDWQKI